MMLAIAMMPLGYIMEKNMAIKKLLFSIITFVCTFVISFNLLAMASHIRSHGEKVLVIDPREHAYGAYDASGRLLRSGTATAGANWCRDIGRPCRTKSGTFRIFSRGGSGCVSRKYPVGKGGAPMPYCMFFNGGQGIHGSYQVVRGNISHGCVRVHVPDAYWLRFNFVEGPNASNHYRGTKVIVRPY